MKGKNVIHKWKQSLLGGIKNHKLYGTDSCKQYHTKTQEGVIKKLQEVLMYFSMSWEDVRGLLTVLKAHLSYRIPA